MKLILNKYKLVLVIFVLFFTAILLQSNPPATAQYEETTELAYGAQIYHDATLARLSDSTYKFNWVKYQYSLGSDQSKAIWINNAHNDGYSVLLSVAKNEAGIGPLTLSDHGKACPDQSELDSLYWEEWEHKGTFCAPIYGPNGEIIGYDTNNCHDEYGWFGKTGTEGYNTSSGYMQFRLQMKKLAEDLRNNRYYDNAVPDVIEIWNEPNLAFEWTAEGFGPVSPANYANFLICGIRGLREGGYTGPVVTAGLAPMPGVNDPGLTADGNMGDFPFFEGFLTAMSQISARYDYSRLGSNYSPPGPPYNNPGNYEICRDGDTHRCWSQPYNSQYHTNLFGQTKNPLYDYNYVGWHSNVTANIPPEDTSLNGFQRVKFALERTTKPVWLTEYGWRREIDGITRAIQLDFVTRAYDVAVGLGIKGMFVFNFGWNRDLVETTSTPRPEDVQNGLWDIESELLTKEKPCEKGDGVTQGIYETDYMTAPTLKDDDVITQKVCTGMVPPDVCKDAKTVAAANLQGASNDDILIAVEQSFFQSIINALKQFLCGTFGAFCTPDLSLGEQWQQGDVETNDVKTEEFVVTTKTVNKSFIPNMQLTPEVRDCNILEDPENAPNRDNITGNKKLNDLSPNLGTNTGLYGVGLPVFPDKEDVVNTQKLIPNANVIGGSKQFAHDKRVPEIDVQEYSELNANFPEGILPNWEGSIPRTPNL